MKCFVYYNLHRKCWSLKAMDGDRKGRVIGHARYVDMTNVEWKVSEAGRQRVLREKRKNVHAGACGFVNYWLGLDGVRYGTKNNTLFDYYSKAPSVPSMVSYNPYKGPSFVDVDTGDPVKRTETAYLCPERKVYTYSSKTNW